MHVKKGDTVVVISGKDAGKKGKVIACYPRENKVVVEGVNVVKKHVRPTPKMMQGGIIEKEAPIAASKVLLFCPNCNRPVRTGKKFLETGEKVRQCKRCGELLDK